MKKRHLTRAQRKTLRLIEQYSRAKTNERGTPDPVAYHQFLEDEWLLAQRMTRVAAILQEGSHPE